VTHYYVYYRVDPARLDELRGAIAQLLARIERATGVRGRWLRRRDEPTTFMEVYEGVADAAAFETLLESESAALGLERHVEKFVCA
jgi:quinol monooxygenase YgiN